MRAVRRGLASKAVSETQRADLVVVGAGVIGLAIAWRARRAGMSVTVLERVRAGAGASSVAAGMLAPVAEVEFGEAGRRALELGLRSAQMWPSFATELEAASQLRLGLMRSGTLLLARDDDDAGELERQLELRESLGLRVRRLLPSRARELEPALAPSVRLALEVADDHAVDPRAVLAALTRACAQAGVELRERSPVARVLLDDAGERVEGVELEDGELCAAGRVVLATGAWSERIAGLPHGRSAPVRPVKGQTVRLRDPAGAGLVGRVLRFRGGYLVPRQDGAYVLGASVEERGFDTAATAGAVYELLRDAHELVPGLDELQIEELCVGLRPGTPDNLPCIGAAGAGGVLWAAGHYRNGVLLAPLTAALVVELLRGGTSDPALSLCAPERFAGAALGAAA